MTEPKRRPKRPDYRPWLPEECELWVRSALKALCRGDATEDQQQRILDWLINNLARTYDVTYFPESVRDSDFASGKRWVGQQIVKLVKEPMPTEHH